MLSIQQELIQLKKERIEKYILISDFLDFLKSQNPNTSYPEIATWLLIKLRDNDIRNYTGDLWGNEAFEAWHFENGIAVFDVPQSIDLEPESLPYELFFDALYEVKVNFSNYANFVEMLDNEKIASIGDFFKGDKNKQLEKYADLSVKRKRLEELLSIEIPVTKPFDDIKETSISIAMALTKTDEFIKNTNINKSPIGTAERLVFEETIAKQKDEIDQLKKQIEALQSKGKTELPLTNEKQQPTVNYNDCSIHGHKSENLEIIFTLAKKISEQCDVDNPHSYPSKEQIKSYVKRYHSDSNKLGEAVYQIIIPEKVKSKGATPKGVETFQGFI